MKLINIFLLYLAMASAASASPGAHGPNGEHLEAPGALVRGDARPRVDTFTEAYELVGHLGADEFSILIDRYDTNEPVLDGKLEVEFDGLKAPAKFHADYGDYAVDDARILKALAQPGKHALLFTFMSGSDSDLLEGTLDVAAAPPAAAAARLPWAWPSAALLAALGLAAFAIKRRRSTTSTWKK